MRIRYGRWSGTQDPFGPDVSADAVLDELSDDLLAGYDPDAALRRLLERGLQGRTSGLDALRRRVEEARRRELSRMGLEGPLRQVEDRLGQILDLERTALEFADDTTAAAAKQAQLDALPPEVASRIGALQDYDWEDAGAREEFARLVDALRRDVAEATFGRLAGAMGSMSERDVARMRAFLADLNGLVSKRDSGADITEDFAEFRQRHSDLLQGMGRDGGLPDTLDELLEEMARRMVAMDALLEGLDADQRAQLADLAQALLDDVDLAFQADQLRRALKAQFPGLGWGEGAPGAMASGTQSGSLSQTVDWLEHVQQLNDLSTALGQDYPGARLEDIDEQALRDALGDEGVHDLSALRQIERALARAGAAHRRQGALELTPRGIRRIGERSLARIYDRATTGPLGSHEARDLGGGGELTGSTRRMHFGDPFRIDVSKTVSNAIQRGGPARRPGQRLRLQPDDFELAEAERRVGVSTVLLLDMSFSMPLRGNWVPAKRVALALQALINGRFPEDRLAVVGFSDYARELAPADLFATGWERVYGTNMQHAFMVARRLLNAQPGTEQQVIMVTDGEPTAHLEGDHACFAWPPEPQTLRLTMAEAARLSRTGATLNVFLLDHDPGAAAFIERMVGAYGGRIFYPDLADLGQVVVRDFLHCRRR